MRKPCLVPKEQNKGALIGTQRQRGLRGGAGLTGAVGLTLRVQPALTGLARRELKE